MEITLLNWSERNPRKDIKNPWWFKLDHNLFNDPKFYDFSPQEMLCFVYFLCEASKANHNGCITVCHEHASRVAHIDTAVVNSTIKKLQQKRIIEQPRRRGTYASVRNPCTREEEKREEEKREEEKREEKTKSCSSAMNDFDFELLYKKYPRKQGKSIGMKRCKTAIKTSEDFNTLSLAIDSYSKHVQSKALEGQFILLFSSFMNQWKDWLAPDAGQSEDFSSKPIDFMAMIRPENL